MSAKLRTCLRCDKQFDSAGPGNRVCPRCAKQRDRQPRGAYAVKVEPFTRHGKRNRKRFNEPGVFDG